MCSMRLIAIKLNKFWRKSPAKIKVWNLIKTKELASPLGPIRYRHCIAQSFPPVQAKVKDLDWRYSNIVTFSMQELFLFLVFFVEVWPLLSNLHHYSQSHCAALWWRCNKMSFDLGWSRPPCRDGLRVRLALQGSDFGEWFTGVDVPTAGTPTRCGTQISLRSWEPPPRGLQHAAKGGVLIEEHYNDVCHCRWSRSSGWQEGSEWLSEPMEQKGKCLTEEVAAAAAVGQGLIPAVKDSLGWKEQKEGKVYWQKVRLPPTRPTT